MRSHANFNKIEIVPAVQIHGAELVYTNRFTLQSKFPLLGGSSYAFVLEVGTTDLSDHMLVRSHTDQWQLHSQLARQIPSVLCKEANAYSVLISR